MKKRNGTKKMLQDSLLEAQTFFGTFNMNEQLPWEKMEKVEEMRRHMNSIRSILYNGAEIPDSFREEERQIREFTETLDRALFYNYTYTLAYQ